MRYDNPQRQSRLDYLVLEPFDITSVPLYHAPVVSRKKGKSRSKGKEKTDLLSQLRTSLALRLTFIGLLISVGFNVYSVAIERPQLRELQKIKQDFPMVQNIYEATAIAKAIPLPESLETTRNLDYFPAVLLHTGPEPAGYFESITYGYALRLVTGNNTYLATDSHAESTDKTVVFSIGELREKRKKLTWFLYEGPWPPEEWSAIS